MALAIRVGQDAGAEFVAPPPVVCWRSAHQALCGQVTSKTADAAGHADISPVAGTQNKLTVWLAVAAFAP